ncbi:lipid II flippase MurJ [Mycobacterium sp. ENV421]|uniref:murein biosynthesis integral membrane protein MurJ n=1 Tax=Mycobacterium sp. ENV421 TaxID=1213407 RepID=UPI0013049A49|nr:lipid II flippase MurJ [Mycobacterium sp. ENV421]
MTDRDRRSVSTGRTSLFASAGTLGATVIGFGRNLALAAAIGTSLVADSYNIANQVPNQVFLLLGGGAIFFVFVPQLIRNARDSPERGDDFGSFLLFAGAVFGVLVTVLLLVFSPLAIRLMGGASWGEPQATLGLRLSLWCIPQVFFYTLFAIASQLMNARGRFNAVAWLPIVNSLTVILACVPIIVVGTVQANSPASMSDWEVALLGGATLFGTVLQSTLLMIFLRRAGFRLRRRFPIRGLGLRTTASMGLFSIANAATFQIANIVTAALSTQAGSAAKTDGYDGRGFTAYFYAQTLLIASCAVASTGLANVLLQRLSGHYAEGDEKAASKELNEAILAMGALLIPVMAIFICLGPLGTELLFTRGETGPEEAKFIGVVLAVLSIGLIPYALHDLLVRPFFAVHNARTPLRSGVIIGSIRIVGSWAASIVFVPQHVLLGIAGAVALAYIVDLPLKLLSLKRKLRFQLSGFVVRGYCTSLAAAAAAAVIIAIGTNFVEPMLPHGWLPRTLLFMAGIAAFLFVYYPLTARSSASLRQLVRWLRG